MTISAINCSPIKPQVSFGNEQENFEKISGISDKINEKIVDSNDIKKPVAVCASIALAALGAYVGAKNVTSALTKKVAPNMGVKVEAGLKTAANAIKANASKLAETAPETKFAKVKTLAGKAVGSVEGAARNLYKKVAYSGLSKEMVNPEKASAALANVAGAVAGASALSTVLTKDSDGDGIKDIMQKSQNVYTGTKTKCGNAFETVNLLGEIAQALA